MFRRYQSKWNRLDGNFLFSRHFLWLKIVFSLRIIFNFRVQRSLWFHNSWFVVNFFLRSRRIHYNFITLWSLKCFQRMTFFYTLIMLNMKLRLGSFRKAFLHTAKEVAGKYMKVSCLVVTVYFSKTRWLLMLKVKDISIYPLYVERSICPKPVLEKSFFRKHLMPCHYLW